MNCGEAESEARQEIREGEAANEQVEGSPLNAQVQGCQVKEGGARRERR